MCWDTIKIKWQRPNVSSLAEGRAKGAASSPCSFRQARCRAKTWAHRGEPSSEESRGGAVGEGGLVPKVFGFQSWLRLTDRELVLSSCRV